jgi:hypothetical protein
MYISFRQKIAGKTEAKKVTGLNFEEIKRKLISEGIEPTSEEIKSRLLDDSNLLISNRERDLILNLNLSEQSRKRVNELEAALIIIGAVLSENNENGMIEDFNWYLETMELKPGDLGITQENISNVSKIKESFERLYSKVLEERSASDEKAESSKDDSYLSNEVIYDFGDGWRVVYVPAAGEIESFPGLSGTSHDRILEGNKNGLCLGSGGKFYQDNMGGKIYSVRDPGNKPRVTIRINDDTLLEAKGKNNNSPDILAAEKADIWFKSLDGLSYKENNDYKSFPPLNIEDARKSILAYEDKAYSNGWAPHWYGKGIDQLDKDVDRRIDNNDQSIIIAGFGKYPAFFERIKSVVIYWCNLYLDGNKNAESVLFGTKYDPPTHEVFKTYKKLNEMSLAVKKLSQDKNGSSKFFMLGLHKIKEYEKYIDTSALSFSSNLPFDFIKFYKEKKESWAEPYLDDTINIFSKQDPFSFLKNFSEMPESKNYIDDAARSFSYENPKIFLEFFHNKVWAKEYVHNCATRIIIDDGVFKFLEKSSKNSYNFIFPWAKQYLDDAAIAAIKENADKFLIIFADNRGYYYNSDYDWFEKHIDFAVKSFFEQRSGLDFIFLYNNREWAKKYLDDAARISANNFPHEFLQMIAIDSKLYKKEWAQKYLDDAAVAFINRTPSKFINWFSSADWAQPYLDLAGKTCAEVSSFIFISRNLKEESFAEKYGKYMNIAITSSLEKDPRQFISKFSEEPWAKEYLDLARKKIEDEENKTAKNNINKRLLKLSKILNIIGIYENIIF